MKNKTLAILVITLASALVAKAQVAQGGNYRLEQSVIASGGGSSADAVNNLYSVSGTAGQPSAGSSSSGGIYTQQSGFWNADTPRPTAAAVMIGGRVVKGDETGISGVIVTLTGGTITTPRIVRTNSFGNFRFDEVESGQIYIITVQHKKYGFGQNSQVFSLTDNLTDVIFRADWQN